MITTAIISAIVVTMGLGFSGEERGHYRETIKRWHAAVIEHVEDEEREKKALEIITDMAKDIIQAHEKTNPIFQQLLVVDKNYESTLEDYQAIIASLGSLWRDSDKSLIDKRFALQETLTDEEWRRCIGEVQKKMASYRKKVAQLVKKQEKERAKQLKRLEQYKKQENLL
ncbi:MAG: hypothetical protein GY762_12405 [Proteobacteria bacterium]|nr:hypothetical protein [Pseudomonadota bacterium]